MAVEQLQEIPGPVEAGFAKTPATGLRKWFAYGTGVAVEIVGPNLRIAVVRVRPGGVEILGHHRIERFEDRPATEWGADLLAFLRRMRVGRMPVNVLLPRHDVIVRHLALPGVDNKDLAAAIAFQIDSLHPYPEDTAAFAWARLPQTSVVLVGIARRDLIDRYANMFTEAGIKMASFTFSAAAIYSACRILVTPPKDFIAFGVDAGEVEAYGESAARPVFSGVFDTADYGRAQRLARSELRLAAEHDAPLNLTDLLASPLRAPEDFLLEPNARLIATAIAGACPRLSLDANLLPEERRSQSSRLIFIPTAILAVALIAACIVLASIRPVEDKKYLEALNAQIAILNRQSAKVAQLDKAAVKAQAQIAVLDRHRRRSQADADALRELTNLLQPPAWLSTLQLTRTEAFLTGEAEQAAPLLKLLDQSPVFRDSSFSQAMTKVGGGSESFIIRTVREGAGTGVEETKK